MGAGVPCVGEGIAPGDVVVAMGAPDGVASAVCLAPGVIGMGDGVVVSVGACRVGT